MSIQTIVNTASNIEINRPRVVTTTISRSQRVKVSERNSSQPWQWRVTPAAYFKWSTSRNLVESIDYVDRNVEIIITLSNPNLSYINGYLGQLSQTQLNNMLITSWTAQTVTLTTLPSLGDPLPGGGSVTANTVVFRPGDFIQPANSRYPYTVVNTVLRGSQSSITVTVARPLIASEGISVTNQNLYVGSNVSWRFIVIAKPSYSVLPRDRMTFNGNFELLERII